MNNKLDYKNKVIQYWIDELPEIKIENTLNERVTLEVLNNNQYKKEIYAIALEIYLHRTASNYGLLGLKYIPNHVENEINASIYYTNNNSLNYKSILRVERSNEYIYSGIPRFYLAGILETLKNYLKNNKDFVGGELIISVGTNCEVGSSDHIFSILTEMLLEILFEMRNGIPSTIHEADKIVEQVFLNKSL